MRGEVHIGRVRPGVLRERAAADLAGRQHGVISRAQAEELGLSAGAIAHRLDTRRWRALHRGVYAVGAGPLADRGRWTAAVLACGQGSDLSHWSGAALWGIASERGPDPHVSAPTSRCPRPGIVVHRVEPLPPEERSVRDGIPVTSVARTLLDLAARVDRTTVARAVDEADRLRLLELGAVRDILRRRRGRPGTRRLADVLGRHLEPAPTRSELESRFLDLIAHAGLPRPRVNVPVAGLEVDALWAEERLVVELDGWAFHRSRKAFERDHMRDTRLRVAGYDVLRFTWRQLREEPAAVLFLLRGTLRKRSPV